MREKMQKQVTLTKVYHGFINNQNEMEKCQPVVFLGKPRKTQIEHKLKQHYNHPIILETSLESQLYQMDVSEFMEVATPVDKAVNK